MKAKFWILFIISIIVVALFATNFFMNLYYYGHYLMMQDGYVFYCISDYQRQFCDNISIRIMELFNPAPDRDYYPDNLEEIDGYAIDYEGDVKHLPFADICIDEMKIILLTHSNIASPDEEFVMEDVELPIRINQEDFERCAHETSFTKSRWNMITAENRESEQFKTHQGLGLLNQDEQKNAVENNTSIQLKGILGT